MNLREELKRSRAGVVSTLILLQLTLASCGRQSPPTSSKHPSVRKAEGAVEPSKKDSGAEVTRVTVPKGTVISLDLLDSLGSATSQAGDTLSTRIIDPVLIGDRVAVPAGSKVLGQVTEVIPAKKGTKYGGGAVTITFDKLETPSGFGVPISASVTRLEREQGKSASLMSGGASGGAALIKANGVGAPGPVGGAGTQIAAITRGKELELPTGSRLVVTLDQPLTLVIAPQP